MIDSQWVVPSSHTIQPDHCLFHFTQIYDESYCTSKAQSLHYFSNSHSIGISLYSLWFKYNRYIAVFNLQDSFCCVGIDLYSSCRYVHQIALWLQNADFITLGHPSNYCHLPLLKPWKYSESTYSCYLQIS